MSAALVVVALVILSMVPTTPRGPRRSGGAGADESDGPKAGHNACCFGCGVPLVMLVALVATFLAMQETADLLYSGDSGEWIGQMWLGVGLGAVIGTFVMCAAVSGQMASATPDNVDRATKLVRFGRAMAILCLAGLTVVGISVIADIARGRGASTDLLARPLVSTIVTLVWLVAVIALRSTVRVTALEPKQAAPLIASEPIPSAMRRSRGPTSALNRPSHLCCGRRYRPRVSSGKESGRDRSRVVRTAVVPVLPMRQPGPLPCPDPRRAISPAQSPWSRHRVSPPPVNRSRPTAYAHPAARASVPSARARSSVMGTGTFAVSCAAPITWWSSMLVPVEPVRARTAPWSALVGPMVGGRLAGECHRDGRTIALGALDPDVAVVQVGNPFG